MNRTFQPQFSDVDLTLRQYNITGKATMSVIGIGVFPTENRQFPQKCYVNLLEGSGRLLYLQRCLSSISSCELCNNRISSSQKDSGKSSSRLLVGWKQDFYHGLESYRLQSSSLRPWSAWSSNPAWKSKLFRENQVVLFEEGALHSLLSPLAFHTFTSLSSPWVVSKTQWYSLHIWWKGDPDSDLYWSFYKIAQLRRKNYP